MPKRAETKLPWFRLYSEILNDRKLGHIIRGTGHGKAVIIGAWTIVLCLANDSPERGHLLLAEDVPLHREDIIREIDLGDAGAVILELFIKLKMLHQQGDTWVIAKWDERQYASDNSTARSQKSRAKAKECAQQQQLERPSNDASNIPQNVAATAQQQDCNDAATMQQRYCIGPDTESDTESDSLGTNVPSDKSLSPLDADSKPETTNEKPPTKNSKSKSRASPKPRQPKLRANPEQPGPKTQLMGAFCETTGMVMPRNESDVKFWWGSIGKILDIVEGDVERGMDVIRRSVERLIADDKTVADPNSIIKTARAIHAGQHQNGANHANGHSQGRTNGTSAKPKKHFNPKIGETYFTDPATGDRVPAPAGH